jgi:hypothetical protein
MKKADRSTLKVKVPQMVHVVVPVKTLSQFINRCRVVLSSSRADILHILPLQPRICLSASQS